MRDGSFTYDLLLPFPYEGRTVESIRLRAVELGDTLDFSAGKFAGPLDLMAHLAGMPMQAIRMIRYPDASIVRERFFQHLPEDLRDMVLQAGKRRLQGYRDAAEVTVGDLDDLGSEPLARRDRRPEPPEADAEAVDEDVEFRRRQADAALAGAHAGDDLDPDGVYERPKTYPDGYGARRPQDEDLSHLSLPELRAQSGQVDWDSPDNIKPPTEIPPGNEALGEFGKLFPTMPPDYVHPSQRPGAKPGWDIESGQGSFSVTDSLKTDPSGSTWRDPKRMHAPVSKEPAKPPKGASIGLDLSDGDE